MLEGARRAGMWKAVRGVVSPDPPQYVGGVGTRRGWNPQKLQNGKEPGNFYVLRQSKGCMPGQNGHFFEFEFEFELFFPGGKHQTSKMFNMLKNEGKRALLHFFFWCAAPGEIFAI